MKQYRVHCPLCKQDFISTNPQGGGCPNCQRILGSPTIICGSFSPIDTKSDPEGDSEEGTQ